MVKGFFFGASALLWCAATVAASAEPQGFLGIRTKKHESPDLCAIIEQLAPGGPAERAGLRPGDVIVTIKGKPNDCAKTEAGVSLIPDLKAGEKVVLGIRRGDQTLEIVAVADPMPVEISQAQEEHDRAEAGRAIFQRLVKNQEVFTVTLLKGGGFKVSGNLTDQESELLHYYFERSGDGAAFPKAIKKESQDMYVRFDRVKKAYQYEFVDSAQPGEPKKP